MNLASLFLNWFHLKVKIFLTTGICSILDDSDFVLKFAMCKYSWNEGREKNIEIAMQCEASRIDKDLTEFFLWQLYQFLT